MSPNHDRKPNNLQFLFMKDVGIAVNNDHLCPELARMGSSYKHCPSHKSIGDCQLWSEVMFRDYPLCLKDRPCKMPKKNSHFIPLSEIENFRPLSKSWKEPSSQHNFNKGRTKPYRHLRLLPKKKWLFLLCKKNKLKFYSLPQVVQCVNSNLKKKFSSTWKF